MGFLLPPDFFVLFWPPDVLQFLTGVFGLLNLASLVGAFTSPTWKLLGGVFGLLTICGVLVGGFGVLRRGEDDFLRLGEDGFLGLGEDDFLGLDGGTGIFGLRFEVRVPEGALAEGLLFLLSAGLVDLLARAVFSLVRELSSFFVFSAKVTRAILAQVLIS